MESNETSYTMLFPIFVNGIMSVISYFLTVRLIPKFKEMFIKGNLFGIDMNKKEGKKM